MTAKPSVQTKGIETRIWSVTPEVREANDDGSIPMRGHAAVFNALSGNLGGFVERIAPGAFTKTVQEADVRLLINHDKNLVLARTKSGTLRLIEDDVGLAVDADMAPTSYAQDLSISMQRGDVTQMSFAFLPIKDDWGSLDDGTPLRTVTEARLFDVSVVTYPAYESTDASLRSAEYHALLDTLGLSDVDEEERSALIASLASDEVSEAHLSRLYEARRRLDNIVSRIESQRQVPLDIYKRRHALITRKLNT